MFRTHARTLLALVAVMLSSSAFAIRFTASEYDWQAEIGKPFAIDLRRLVTEVDTTKPVVFSADHLPKWAKLDANTGLLVGTPGNDAYVGAEMFSVLVVQGNAGDAAKVYLRVDNIDTQTPNLPVWLSTLITLQGCVGRPLASSDLSMKVMLSNPGYTLPLPTIQISSVNRPDWLVEVRNAGGAYYLTGTPTAAGSTFFQVRACAKTTCRDAAVEVKVAPNCP